jgi:hypothetical protein
VKREDYIFVLSYYNAKEGQIVPRPLTLSYALNKKTDKILKAYHKRNKTMTIMVPIGIVTGLLWCYFLGNMDRYLGAWSKIFTVSMEVSALVTSIEEIYLYALLFTTVLFVSTYTIWNQYNEKYKQYKKEILKILEVDACEHRSPCSCKDDYCYWLEQEEGIDLL